MQRLCEFCWLCLVCVTCYPTDIEAKEACFSRLRLTILGCLDATGTFFEQSVGACPYVWGDDSDVESNLSWRMCDISECLVIIIPKYYPQISQIFPNISDNLWV